MYREWREPRSAPLSPCTPTPSSRTGRARRVGALQQRERALDDPRRVLRRRLLGVAARDGGEVRRSAP